MRIVAALVVPLICGAAVAQTDAYKAAAQQGVELHDRGEFDAAIRVYAAMLAEHPGDPLLMYETAMSYQAKQDYAHCIEFASQVAAKPSDLRSAGYSVLASCQDDAGQLDQSVATFKEALEKFPREIMLNLNYGLTLVRLAQAAEARRVLGIAIDEAPGFASPYRAYALALAEQGYPASAVLVRLRFIMSEPESERAIDAAKLIVDAVASASAAARDNQINLTMGEDDDKQAAAMTATEFSFGIAVLSADALSKELAKKDHADSPAAARLVNSLQLFITMSAERAGQEGKPDLPWTAVLEPLTMLSQKDVLEPFLYHVAALGRSEGAVNWINEHGESMGKLADVINDYHASLQRR